MSDPVDPTPPPAAPLAGRMDDRPESNCSPPYSSAFGGIDSGIIL